LGCYVKPFPREALTCVAHHSGSVLSPPPTIVDSQRVKPFPREALTCVAHHSGGKE
jgi:hypothetical protein